MENRERDRVSQRATPTAAGDLNRKTEEAKGRDDGSSVEFGKHIGDSESLTADTRKENLMNRDKDLNSEGIGSSRGSEMDKNKNRNTSDIGSSGRNSGSEGFGSSQGRGSSGSMGSGSDVSSDTGSGNVSSGSSGSRSGSEGRH